MACERLTDHSGPAEKDLSQLRRHGNERAKANPLALSYEKLVPILEMIRRYLPKIEVMYTQGRLSDLRNKTVDQLRHLKELGMREISLGVESGVNLTGPDFPGRKDKIIAALDREIKHGNLDMMAAIRRAKQTL